MATRYFCDICNKEAENHIRVGWFALVCWKCWKDESKWEEIHKKVEKKEK